MFFVKHHWEDACVHGAASSARSLSGERKERKTGCCVYNLASMLLLCCNIVHWHWHPVKNFHNPALCRNTLLALCNDLGTNIAILDCLLLSFLVAGYLLLVNLT
jgi:hypothetical protein